MGTHAEEQTERELKDEKKSMMDCCDTRVESWPTREKKFAVANQIMCRANKKKN